MPIGLAEKQALVAEMKAAAGKALSAVLADYRGVSVAGMTALRREARQADVQLRVVRNTLAKRAFEGTAFECMNEALTGPSLLAFSLSDPGAGARLFKAFARDNDAFEVRALSLEGRLLPASQLDLLATLPTRDQALSLLMATMLAPIAQLARTLKEVPAKATRTLAALRDQKQQDN